MPQPAPAQIDAFITRWENSGAAERANYQMFLAELADLLDVPRPDPTTADPAKNLYVFDRAITRVNPDGTTATGYIDCYKARHFVLETKQGATADDPATADAFQLNPAKAAVKTGHGKRGTAAFDRALERAFHQARGYITALPIAEGRPPFLIVCDVGFSLDFYAEFSGTGGHYERFPDPKNHRITLADLRRPEIRDLLRAIWLDPHSLDPAKKAAQVTRDIADRLARLAKSLEADGHDAKVIAGFLQRCLFTMFAEDIGLLPAAGFKTLLDRIRDAPHGFPVLITALWKEMATGTNFSALLFQEIACFNGGLFENTTALPVSPEQLAMLTDAAATDWSAVEPSIFGTLLTRALDPRERHKLGAEYTPRSYVERLIRPTIIDPLREQWDAVRVAAASLHGEADAADEAADEMDLTAKAHLAAGNSAAAKDTGAAAAKLRAEANKKDAAALKLVTDFHRHLCALKFLDPACGTANFLYVTLEHLKRLEAEVLELVTALGGDATFEMTEYKVRPEQFLGLEINPNAVAIAQLVLWIGYFQWQRKTTGKADTGDRPLLPKTPSIRQQDAVLAYDQKIPRRDPATGVILTIWNGHSTKPHPVTGKEVPDEAATIALFDYINPRRAEWPQADYIVGNPPFIGASRMRDALGDGYTEALRKAWQGEVPESADFVMFWWRKAAELVRDGKAKRFGFITTNSIHQTFNRRVIESFVGRDGSPSRPENGKGMIGAKNGLKGNPLGDPFPAHSRGPLGDRSLPLRLPLHLAYAIPDHPWIDSADGAAVRIAMTVAAPGSGEGILEKVITEQARENGEHEVTLIRSGGLIAPNLQIGADLTSCGPLQANLKISCPTVKLHGSGFIVSDEKAIELGLGRTPGNGERLDAHRKRQQELHPDLTLTGLYNVLEKLRSGEPLTAKDKLIHDQGLVTLLKQLHDDLDAAVLEAYGWSDLLNCSGGLRPSQNTSGGEAKEPAHDQSASDGHRPPLQSFEQELLTRLVALNHEWAAEEERGLIRWLRPDYQAPASSDGHRPTLQAEIGLTGEADARPETAAPVVLDWPAGLPAQVAAINKLLATIGPDPEALAACFGRKSKKRADQIAVILATLKALGHIN